MPHDKHGQVLAVGDEVLIRARVTQVYASDDYCNVSCQTVEPMYPGEHKSSFTLNAKQVEKVAPAAVSMTVQAGWVAG